MGCWSAAGVGGWWAFDGSHVLLLRVLLLAWAKKKRGQSAVFFSLAPFLFLVSFFEFLFEL